MNDSLSQYCPSDLHGYLAVLVRTTSPQHIFSPQVQTPPGRPRQLQAHLGEIPPGQERLDPLRSSSRSLRAARHHESEDRRRAEQQRFHRGGGEVFRFSGFHAFRTFPPSGGHILRVQTRLSRRCLSGRRFKRPQRTRAKNLLPFFYLRTRSLFLSAALKFSFNSRINVGRCVIAQRELR